MQKGINVNVLDLLMLYISKSGSVIVGVFILPLYQELLGPDTFGVVALILSLQAFLMMLDLGMSTLVGRDLSLDEKSKSYLNVLHAAQLVLHIAFFMLLASSIAVYLIFSPPISLHNVALAITFFWALTVQNVGQSATIARKRYRVAGYVQSIGVLGRAAITVGMLYTVNSNLSTFLISQTCCAIVQMVFTGWLCQKILKEEAYSYQLKILFPMAKKFVIRGKHLFLSGLSGAAVLHLDKVIISLLVSPVELAPYFLASTLCLTPINVMAGPIAQYFQPQIINSLSKNDYYATETQMRWMVFSIMVVVIIPSLVLWVNNDWVVNTWLDGQNNVPEVIKYVSILLPGAAIGAFGFVPYTILIACQDYSAQFRLSAIMTFVTLSATFAFGLLNSVIGVCWIYASYHTISAIVLWVRSSKIQSPNPQNYVASVGLLTAKIIVLVFVTGLGYSIYSHIFN